MDDDDAETVGWLMWRTLMTTACFSECILPSNTVYVNDVGVPYVILGGANLTVLPMSWGPVISTLPSYKTPRLGIDDTWYDRVSAGMSTSLPVSVIISSLSSSMSSVCDWPTGAFISKVAICTTKTDEDVCPSLTWKLKLSLLV
eukprot:29998_1